MTPEEQSHCTTCGIALNADGTVDELDPLDPTGHYASCDQTDPCVCGNKHTEIVHWNTAHGDQIVAMSCSDACSERIESRRDTWGILTLLSVNDLRMSACTNPDHDHAATQDRDGNELSPDAAEQPMRCFNCWAPAHFSETTGTYQHDHATTSDCFLSRRDTPCTQPTRCATCNHIAGGHFLTCSSS